MSRLDRIYTNLNNFKQIDISVSWTVCDSDHALVRATFVSQDNKPIRPKIRNLDPQVVMDPNNLIILREYLLEQLATLREDVNPHLRLEYAKMTIRTKAYELSKKMQSEEFTNLRLLDEDIKLHERLLREGSSPEEEAEIILHMERQTNEKNRILDRQGKNLAWKAKTKWYNEGERSNKYFLNLLKRNTVGAEMTSIIDNGNQITDPIQIENCINDYYSRLYDEEADSERLDENIFSEMFKLQIEEATTVTQPLTLAELGAALKPLKDTTPGPDAISHIYLKKLWYILGPLIVKAWQYSIEQNKLPPSHERSFLRIIPKAGKDTKLLKNW
jgi:hypothetical protein